MHDPNAQAKCEHPARRPSRPGTVTNALQEHASSGTESARATERRASSVARTERRRDSALTLICAALAACATTAFATSAHAAPAPDAARPLDYHARTVARALPEWGINALEQADASGWYWTPTRSTCVRTKPAHYRCDATGAWSTVGESGVRMTYRLRYCAASRRIGTHAFYFDGRSWRARVRVDQRGGISCRAPHPPYTPAS